MKVCSEVGCTTVVGRKCKGLCHTHYHIKYRDVNRQRINESRRKYRTTNPEKVAEGQRRRHYALVYNLVPQDYETLHTFQESHPAYRLLLGNGRVRDSIEHRHSDGLIRGVMAPMLNKAYGLIERLYPTNTAAVLRALADFHENPPAVAALGEKVYGLIGKAKRKKRMVYGPDGRPNPIPRAKRAVEV